jgi:RNA polymerase sigma-70 factor, ECF subfamily
VIDIQKENIQEQEWLAKFRKGDEKTFKEMFFHYYPALFCFVDRYVKSKDTADIIVKDLFIDIWQKCENLNIRISLKAYLYSAARNRALNFLKTQKSHNRHLTIYAVEDEELDSYRSSDNDPLENLEKKEFELEVHKAIESLPGKTRLVFTLHRDDGLSYKEIADVLKISIKTVENQMARAFRILRDNLSHIIVILLFSLTF